MRPIQDLYNMDFEDTGDFGGDALSQNDALASFIAPQPVPQPVPQPIFQAPAADPIAQLFASQQPIQQAPVEDIPAEFLTPKQIAAPAPIPTPTPAPAAPVQQPKVDYTDALVKQILGSSDTSKWTGQGYGSAEANARDMAKILANAGITDVRQLGVRQEVIPASSGEWGESPEQTVNKYYNKVTGQELGNTYAERQTGNFFGGTFTGKGNTGYGVQFRPDGTPVFYTQGASSNDVAQIMQMAGPVGQIAAAYFGGPAAVAAIAAASGKPVGDIIKSAALSYLGGAAGNAVSGIEGITDVLGQTGTDIVSNAAKQFVGSGGKVDPVAALLAGGLSTGVNSLATELGMGELTPAQQKMLSSGVMGLVTGQTPEQLAMSIAMAGLIPTPDKKLTSSLGPGDPEEFKNSLIPGYFQPGGAGYIEPQEPVDFWEPNPVEPTPTPAEPEPEKRIIPAERLPMEVDPTIEPIPFDLKSILQLPSEPEPEPEPKPEPVAPSEPKPEPVAPSEPAPEPTPAPIDFWEPNPVEPEPVDFWEPNPVEPEPTPEPTPPPDDEKVPELVMTAKRPTGEMTVTDEPDDLSAFLRSLWPYASETEPGTRTLPAERPSSITEEFPPIEQIPFDPMTLLPTLPTLPVEPPKAITPKISAPVKAATSTAPTTPATPAASSSSGTNLAGLLALLSAGQQPAQQAPMQDPYAHIKLMEDLFGSNIDLTPVGEDTAKRK